MGTDVDENGALVMPGAKKGVFVNGELMSPDLVREEEVGGEEEVQIFGEVDDGSFDDGVGFELNDDYMPDNEEEEPNHIDQVVVEDQQQSKEKEAATEKTIKNIHDPWEELDPHQPTNDRVNPLKIGITYRLPLGMDEGDLPSKSVTGSRTTRSTKSTKIAEETEKNTWSNTSPFIMDRHKDENGPAAVVDWMNMKKMLYGEEFAYLAERYGRYFDLLARQKRRQEESDGNNDQVVPYEADYDDDDYGAGFDYGGDDDYSYGNNDAVDNPENHRMNRSNVDFDAIDSVFHTAGFHTDENDIDHNNSPMTFEELCRAHLRKFAKSAEIYAAETQLTKRVGAWQTGLGPILEEQEKRPEFDIHTMGREILQKVEDGLSTRKRGVGGEKKLDAPSNAGDKSNIVGFRQLSKDKEEYEVCRLFLSTLMLCNCGNVLVHDGNDVGSTESLQLELLNSKFEAVMEEFLAPSLAEDGWK